MLFRSQIVFVEDEVTTGKTILNCVNNLRVGWKIKENTKFFVLSILNCMSSVELEQFKESNIQAMWLIRAKKPVVSTVEIKCENPRFGINIADYHAAIEDAVRDFCYDSRSEKICVIGTEECMYPAMIAAEIISKRNPHISVKMHATTRVPVCIDGEEIKSRIDITSLYDGERDTYLYNMESCDLAIVVTDAAKNEELFSKFSDELKKHGAKDVLMVRFAE